MRDRNAKPILAAVKRMHSEADIADDAATGYDPYRGRAARTIPVPGEFTPDQINEASAILACYETELTIKE